MKEITRRSKVLRFSKLEKELMETLSDKPESISRIASRMDSPRTSLYRPLKSLSSRGFVEKTKKGKRHYWRSIPQETLIAALSPALFSMTDNTNTPLHPEFFLHTGKEILMLLYEKLADKVGARVLGIQPNRSAESVLKIFPFERLVRLNERIKTQNVIVEAILQEDFIPFYINLLKKRGFPVRKIFDAFVGRAADTMYIPKEFINFDSEIVILPTTSYIFHWSKLVAIEIRNKETLGLLRDLFALAKQSGSKVNQNELVRKYLRDRAWS
ncbi:MAG: hypothetical protein HYT39_03555 [Candidatus Sungbacteria bacterium]|nr:hypothetical protein [Candidatus Sungbacteria bacterium]